MKTAQTHTSKQAYTAHGFASILIVLSTGIALMIMLLAMYEDTIQTQSLQKNNMLSNDYQQREDAFLRALIDIVPNQAMRSMTDDSWNDRGQLKWNKALSTALVRANAKKALPNGIANSLGVSSLRTGNSADFTENISSSKVVFAVSDAYINKRNSNPVSAGIKKFNAAVTKHYPPHLTETGGNAPQNRSTAYPIISNSRIYDDTVDGWVDEKSNDSRFGLIPLPKNHFRYKDGATFIAKHNWWTFKVNFAAQQQEATQLNTRLKQYIFSIYEVPAQLAINSASNGTILGKHETAGDWNSNVNVEGAVFASQLKTEGSFTSSSISSRKNIELSADTSIGSESFGGSDLIGNNREVHESKGHELLITSAGEGGGIAFIPINGGEFETTDDAKKAAFYDNPDLTLANFDPAANESSTNAVSPTSWNYYSRGACQCKMRVVFNDSQFSFSFEDDSVDDDSESVDSFTNLPDFSKAFIHDQEVLTVNLEELLSLLTAQGIAEGISNSLYVKYEGTGASQVIIDNAEDLSSASQGFSFVTNSHLVIASNLNNLGAVPVPLSIFSPTTQFGNSSYQNKINITGQLNSTAKAGTSYIADLKSGDGNVNSSAITANLQSLISPTQLPPINMMNWMIVIREKHK